MRRSISTLILITVLYLHSTGQSTEPFSNRQLDSLERLNKIQRSRLQNKPGINLNHTAARRPVQLHNLMAGAEAGRISVLCHDTSSVFSLNNSTYEFYPSDPVLTADGHMLISGEYAGDFQNNPSTSGGFLMKCDLYGHPVWMKLYDSAANIQFNFLNFYKVKELQDGTILLAGSTNNQVTGNNDLVIARASSTGNLIWVKTYKSRIWTQGSGSADYFYIQDWKQDPADGDIYFCGPHWSVGKSLTRIRVSDGTVFWSNLYQFGTNGEVFFDSPFGIDILPNEIRYFGKFLDYRTFISMLRINKQTGDTLSYRMLHGSDTAGTNAEFLGAEPLVKGTNGHYYLSGKCYGEYLYPPNGSTPFYQGSVVEVDSNLNFLGGKVYRNPYESNMYNSHITVNPDGSGFLNTLEVISGFTAYQDIVQFKQGFILNSRRLLLTNEGIPFEHNTIQLPDGADLLVHLAGDSIANWPRIMLRKFHVTDTSSTCLGIHDQSSFVQPVQYENWVWRPDSLGYQDFSIIPNKTWRTRDYMVTLQNECSIISRCDSVKLIAAPATICLGDSISITVRKNPGCGINVPFVYDTSAVSFVRPLNDSVFIFHFQHAWTGYITGLLPGCSGAADSVFIRVLQSPGGLNLGPDTVLCPGNNLHLNAHTGFASYIWQDGSVDSAYTVTQPGLYYVTVSDACGGQLSDTVHVLPHPPVPVNIGPDRTKCNSDSIHLTGPAGFISYSWSPNYFISALNSQSVVVNPQTDTSYMIRAELTPGCFGFDTVRVTVYHSPVISLGPDRSLCSGDSAVLDAGTGFQQYLWSGNQTSQHITVFQPGLYTVAASTSQGCVSKDSLQILQVYPLPVIQLPADTTLCTGSSRLLDAGAGYSVYQWSTGSTSQSIQVNTTGIWSVSVTDAHGCKGAAAARINTMLPSPAGFLPADTSICDYGTVTLNSTGSYRSYLWSDLSGGTSLLIRQPGVYWLQVTNAAGCTGTDTVTVLKKQCMTGVFVPLAFTPNRDGLNDVFKPIVLGNAIFYRFSVYNRWGELVFQSTDTGSGWDGRYHGLELNSAVFNWICEYQLVGEEKKIQSGSVTLIR